MRIRFIHSRPHSFLFLAIALTILFPATGYSAKKSLPSSIRAKSVYMNQKTGMVVYRGNVRLKRDNLIITADRVSIRVVRGKVRLIIAKGSPLIVYRTKSKEQKPFRVTAQSLEYRVGEKILALSGKVSFQQERSTINCDRILYNREKDTLLANSSDGGRVEATIFPKHDTKGDTDG